MEIATAVRSLLSARMGAERFALWFGPNTRFECHGDELLVRAPNAFFLNWLQRNFRQPIEAAAREVMGPTAAVRFCCESAAAAPPEQPPASAPAAPPAAPPAEVAAPAGPQPLRLLAPEVSSAAPAVAFPRRKFAQLSQVVVGHSNRLAHTSAQMVIDRPGSLSPLVLCGATGVGKTMLLESIWSGVRHKHGDVSAVFQTAEQFTTQFLDALRGSGLPSFRRKFRSVDLLIIDDLQFFAGKRATIVELLHTVNALMDAGRQLVFAADRVPAELVDLGPELIQRLTGGLVCRIEPAEYEVRRGILRAQRAEMGLSLCEEVEHYIASNLTSHAREISGALNRLHAAHCALGQPLTLAMAQETLADLVRTSGRLVRLADIEKAVCNVFGLEGDSLHSARRGKTVSHPRMLAMWLARKHTRAALSEIGSFFGRRSHSTVISAQKKVADWVSRRQSLVVADRPCDVEEAIRRIEHQLLAG